MSVGNPGARVPGDQVEASVTDPSSPGFQPFTDGRAIGVE